MAQEIREEWNLFVADVEPLRLKLFKYCLSLTRNPFDAEDLPSETIIRTFVSRAFTSNNIESPEAFLIRVASRLWIDEWRRRNSGAEIEAEQAEETAKAIDLAEITDGVNAMYGTLSPVQRAILVLK